MDGINWDTRYPETSQQGMAALFGVDRTTVRARTLAGMPYRASGKGEAGVYVVPVCIAWHVGRKVRVNRQLPSRGAVVAILTFRAIFPDAASLSAWERSVCPLAQAAGATREEHHKAVGIVIGEGLLTLWPRQADQVVSF